MEILKYGILSVLGLSALIILILAIRSRKFFKTILFNAFLGIGALAIIDLTSKYSGVYIPINYWTVGTGGLLGIPGICGVLISNFIFI